MTPPAGVVLIGYGLAGEVFHAPLIHATDRLSLEAVVTRDPARRERAAAAYPGIRLLDDPGALWELQPELVVVASPNSTHVELARHAMAAGAAVVVDKPLAVDSAGAQALLAQAARNGGRLTVFHNRRWDGDFITAADLLTGEGLGRPLRMESRFERFRPQIKEGWRERGGLEHGGGQLLDLGSHLVDQAIVLFGEPLRVYAELALRRTGALVEDDAFLALEHPDGVFSHLWMSSVAPLAGPRLAISGTRGGFSCDGLDPQEAQLAEGLRPGDAGYGERPPGRLVTADGVSEQPITAGRYQDFYAGVRDWLEGIAAAPVDPRDALAGLRVLDAARRSAAEHRVVAMGEEEEAAQAPTETTSRPG